MTALVDRDAVVKPVWAALGVPIPSDAVLDILIDQSSVRIETFCGRIFARADYVEILEGNGDRELPTRQRPINSIASVYEDRTAYWGSAADAWSSATLLTDGVDYTFVKDGNGGVGKSGLLVRINSVWPRPIEYRGGNITPRPASMGNVKVSYNAGFATIPSDVQNACMTLLANVRRVLFAGQPLQSEGWDGYTYAVQQATNTAFAGLPSDTLGALIRHRNTPVG